MAQRVKAPAARLPAPLSGTVDKKDGANLQSWGYASNRQSGRVQIIVKVRYARKTGDGRYDAGAGQLVRAPHAGLAPGHGHCGSVPTASAKWAMTPQMIAFRHRLRPFSSMYRVLSPPTR